ncbi:MAG: 4-alpha-glucanotransferase, partial [Candidatus Omnitrophica bacterium]|nr:4-alpha-glucanotransferase [Candidatus Omnitrophota bacterium]
KWRKIGTVKRAGVLAPLFSLYSHNSLGIGDFGDLKLLVDCCAKSGISIIQLLPLNEVGASFCPYDALSSFALEPSYLSFNFLDDNQKKSVKKEIDNIKQLFPPGKPHVDYRIKREKIHLLSDIFMNDPPIDLRALEKFKKDNAYWLEDYALFITLKEYHLGLPWYDWQEEYKSRNQLELKNFREEHAREIEFQAWMQYLLYSQLKSIKDYAAKNKVFIKGDLPILVSRDSADVWAHREFFKLEFAAGAPPDMYCAKGQRWGMPTYNWENIVADNYKYVKEKLKYAENFYDIVRVDHVVGLFRIWSIPYNDPQENQGLHGFFDPPEVERWKDHGKNILNVMLDSTKMLLCAEDLGVIPQVCPDTLKELGIPGNDVQRWVKDWSNRHDFLKAEEYRELSVTMLSAHDTTNWAAWWKYEAGTVDEALFIRKCNDRLIDYTMVRDRLFDMDLSFHGRLRWKDTVVGVHALVTILGRKNDDVLDFIDMYLNTYQEKEKLWKLLGMPGPMQEEASPELIEKALKFNFDSASIFSVQLITDILSVDHIFKGDPYQYRINFPGIISEKNWSMTVPVALEELSRHKVCEKIRKMLVEAKRV